MITEPTIHTMYKVQTTLKTNEIEGEKPATAKGSVVRIIGEKFGKKVLCQSVEDGWVANIDENKLTKMKRKQPLAADGGSLAEAKVKWEITLKNRKEEEERKREKEKAEKEARMMDKRLNF